MASPPPSYTAAASVSRSKTSRDEIRSMADELLRSSLSANVLSAPTGPVAHSPASMSRSASSASAASVSRSKGSRDDVRSMADMMLRSSLSRSVSSASSVSITPPSYQSKRSASSTLPYPPGLGADPLISGREKPTRSVSGPAVAPVTSESKSGGDNSSSPRVTAAESKLRVQKLQREVDWVSAHAARRSTAGLFKAACSTDLLFLIDTTYSMQSYIDAAKVQVTSIVADIQAAFLNESIVRVAVVAYKDHNDMGNIQFLDFTPSADQVRRFLDTLSASGGGDIPEDVLGGIQKALNASWKQQTRCIVHITDAPPHGRALHDLHETQDNYYTPGSEPHGLTYEPLLRQLLQLKINYALLRINSSTDRMALEFSRVYAAASGDVKLLPSNTYYSQVNGMRGKVGRASSKPSASATPQFEELQLGITYAQLRKLVVKTVTNSVSRTASRLSIALSSGRKSSSAGGKDSKAISKAANLAAIREDEDSGGSTKTRNIPLETSPPQWDRPGWLDETLVVEGFCPDVVVHSASTLNDMMDNNENIKLGVAELTVSARSKPFAHGAVRLASYARTAASTNRFVVKSFIEDGMGLAPVVEDMQIQALCKAFALEFNSLTKTEPPIDFVVTMCLQRKPAPASGDGCLSIEPFLEGDYIKYNSNSCFVREDSPDDPFNQTAQAFSHFTFERSWGHFLVSDLQGVGHLLTDPAVQTRNPERFKLNDTNLNEDGFKCFFAVHKCNPVCRRLELKSTSSMLISGVFEFRERWPTMDPTVCCSNKLCRRIVRLASAHVSDKFKGFHWCDECWPQLEASPATWICVGPGPNHTFEVSRFFHESQGRAPPRKCPDHIEKDTSVSSAAVVGGSLWSRMKEADRKREFSGRLR